MLDLTYIWKGFGSLLRMMMYYAQWAYMFYYISICTQLYVPCAQLRLHGSIFCTMGCAETFCIARTLSHDSDQWLHEQTSFCSCISPVQQNGEILLHNHRPLVMLWRIHRLDHVLHQPGRLPTHVPNLMKWAVCAPGSAHGLLSEDNFEKYK